MRLLKLELLLRFQGEACNRRLANLNEKPLTKNTFPVLWQNVILKVLDKLLTELLLIWT